MFVGEDVGLCPLNHLNWNASETDTIARREVVYEMGHLISSKAPYEVAALHIRFYASSKRSLQHHL